MRNYPYVIVNNKGKKAAKSNHPWVFEDTVVDTVGTLRSGDIVDVYSENMTWLGAGFVNTRSQIRVRLLSVNANDTFDDSFFKRRVSYAIRHRYNIMKNEFGCIRLIFGEADGLPGLTVDRFDDVLVCEITCLGTDERKQVIYEAIVDELYSLRFPVSTIYERNEIELRNKEGLELYKGYYSANGLKNNKESVIIEENGIKYNVDFINGQKTGFFLDQKYNRRIVAGISENKTVLDCCTHTGAFALNCAKNGCLKAYALDISHEALENARKNAELNGLQDKIEYIESDVFDYLRMISKSKTKPYDLIILDPPAFTKSSKTTKNAYRGYREINCLAMKSLKRGSYLATCSCSHFMTEGYFKTMLHEAAEEANVRLLEVYQGKQSPDHPILWGVPESYYLKFFVFQIQ